MSLIDWNSGYSVNVKEIDDQHKKLIDLINKLYDEMKKGHGKEALSGVLKELVDYTKYHFQAEEKLLSKHNFPHLAAHKKEHEELTKKVEEINEKIASGKMVISSNVLTFLKDWLNNHILVEDKGYSKYLNEKGVK